MSTFLSVMLIPWVAMLVISFVAIALDGENNQ